MEKTHWTTEKAELNNINNRATNKGFIGLMWFGTQMHGAVFYACSFVAT